MKLNFNFTDGNDGISCTHSWNGTVLSVTSASGTSSADLIGPQGPTVATGPTGPAGADGTTFTPQSPLSLSNGVLSVDLSDYLEVSDLPLKLWAGASVPSTGENGAGSSRIDSAGMTVVAVGDLVLNFRKGIISQVTSVSSEYFGYKGVVELSRFRGIVATTDIDLASGVTSMRFTFSSIGATTLDFRGFDPSSLTDQYYCFGGASSLTTIYADSTLALPSSGISGSQCFYNGRNLVGGNGTAWSSSNVGYTYFRVDAAGTPGYLTAA